MRELKNRLKQCQPYYIERDLLPNLYFREDRQEIEKWVFVYSFIRRLPDVSIGVRLGYTSQNIYHIKLDILKANKDLINDFLFIQRIF